MPIHRPDETYHRLLFWTYGSALSERLAGHLLFADGYRSVDPSQPLGGPDQGADATCVRDCQTWVMASYFPYGQHPFSEVMAKLKSDIDAARHRNPVGVAFVTNQRLTNTQKARLSSAGEDIGVDVFHLERIVHLLDSPAMSQIREQYIYLPATGLPPMSIKATVVGTAHAFVEDKEVLERFVQSREKQIRKRSDEGHARVRAEREAKERADREGRAREEAERARAAQERPWNIGAKMPTIVDLLGHNSALSESLTQVFQPRDLGVHSLFGMEKPAPPEPFSEVEIQAQVDAYRAEIEDRWPTCRNYLAGVAWSPLRIHIENQADSFLNDVEVIMTFHGAVGIEYEGMDGFEFKKVENPDWRPPVDPYRPMIPMPVPRLARGSGQPIKWERNENGDLEVTINLDRLRPYPAWRSDSVGADIVLVVQPDTDVEEVTVTYTVTAQGYGKEFVGESFAVPVDKVPMLDVLRDALKATKEAS